MYSYNIWSGTDLNKSIQYQTEYTTGRDITVTSSNEYSNTGDYSIKLISNENSAWVRFKLQEISQYVGKTLTVSAMIYSPLTTLGVSLTFFDSNNVFIKNRLSLYAFPLKLSMLLLDKNLLFHRQQKLIHILYYSYYHHFNIIIIIYLMI